MSLRRRKEFRSKEKGRGWETGSQPYVYPGGSAEVGAYQRPGSGAGTPQAGGPSGYSASSPEKTISWPGPGGNTNRKKHGGYEDRRVTA